MTGENRGVSILYKTLALPLSMKCDKADFTTVMDGLCSISPSEEAKRLREASVARADGCSSFSVEWLCSEPTWGS